MRNWKSATKGFTLIELLIVVAIIGILAALLMTNFVGVRERARDAQRKSDLRQLQSALELYRSDNGQYPSTSVGEYKLPAGVGGGSCPSAGTFSFNGTTYMKQIPCDPLGISNYNTGNYFYTSDGSTYTLAACIENANDTDKNITSTAPTGPNASMCTTGKFFQLQNP